MERLRSLYRSIPDLQRAYNPHLFSPDNVVTLFRRHQAGESQNKAIMDMQRLLIKENVTRDDILEMNEHMIEIIGRENGNAYPRDLFERDEASETEAIIRFDDGRVDDVPHTLVSVDISSKAIPEIGRHGFSGHQRIFLDEGSNFVRISAVGTLQRVENGTVYASYIDGENTSITGCRTVSSDVISLSRHAEPKALRSFYTRALTLAAQPYKETPPAFPGSLY